MTLTVGTRLPRYLLDHLLDNTTGDHPGRLITTTFDEDTDLTARGLAYTDDAGDAWMTPAGWETARHHAAKGTRSNTAPRVIDEPLYPGLPAQPNQGDTVNTTTEVRTTNGTIVGAITRDPDGTWEGFLLTADGAGYEPVGQVTSIFDATDLVIAAHNSRETPVADTEHTDTDDAPMTVEQARAHFEAMGVQIVDGTQIRVVS